MRKIALLAALLLPIGGAHALPYGVYDVKQVLTATEASDEKTAVDPRYLDLILNDLASHARTYPPRFDSPQDRKRAEQDIRELSATLEPLANVADAHPELLLRVALLNAFGHNLDIPGAGNRGDAFFRRLLAESPDHPRGNYQYGTFLAGAGHPKAALPYLERALSAGVKDAGYTLGMAHLYLGDQKKALDYLENYQKAAPSDGNVARLVDALKNGKLKIQRSDRPR